MACLTHQCQRRAKTVHITRLTGTKALEGVSTGIPPPSVVESRLQLLLPVPITHSCMARVAIETWTRMTPRPAAESLLLMQRRIGPVGTLPTERELTVAKAEKRLHPWMAMVRKAPNLARRIIANSMVYLLTKASFKTVVVEAVAHNITELIPIRNLSNIPCIINNMVRETMSQEIAS
jgi:hypothetical protein